MFKKNEQKKPIRDPFVNLDLISLSQWKKFVIPGTLFTQIPHVFSSHALVM